MKQIKAFTICDAGYIDAGIVAITSFLKFNKNIPLVVFMEDGTNCRRLQEATEGKNVEIRPRTFPELRGHHGLGANNPYFDLFVNSEALPAYAMRLQALEELRNEADIPPGRRKGLYPPLSPRNLRRGTFHLPPA